MTKDLEIFDELVVVFQDPASRSWTPVGRPSFRNEAFHIQYTLGATQAYKQGAFLPFGVMRKLAGVYRSRQLFTTFKNRIMPRSRPEYPNYTRWLLGEPGELSPLEEPGLSRDARATLNIQLYPIPKDTDATTGCPYSRTVSAIYRNPHELPSGRSKRGHCCI